MNYKSTAHLTTAIIVFLVFGSIALKAAEFRGTTDTLKKWVGTWSTAPQLVETGNNPPNPGLTNNTLRQIVHVSIGGDTLQMRFTNEFSTNPVTMYEVHIAVSKGGGIIDPTTDTILRFNGETEVTMAAGAAITSDPFRFDLEPLSDIAITIYFGETSSDVSGHPGSRTTSYILTGNESAKEDFSNAVQTDHWYVINTIDVLAPDSAAAIAILGDSITDGRGSGTNKQNRWPDELSRRLQENTDSATFGILNEGIGGNCVLGSCLGPSALSRFNRDVINQNGVKWLIILEGINDIGYAWGTQVAQELISAYQQMIEGAHAKGIFVYGATLLPIGGSSYYSDDHETIRTTVNQWIRNSGSFDGVIDLDKGLRNPADTLTLLPIADSGDHLHPSETGHRMMAEAVDLSLFNVTDTLSHVIKNQTIYFEPECTEIGSNWDIVKDDQASGGYYVTVRPDTESVQSAPVSIDDQFAITFNADTSAIYYIYGRLNCPTADDDSYWFKMDTGSFDMVNNLGTSGWEWVNITSYTISAGEHTLTIAYRENGAKMDKICISNYPLAPDGMGETAENACVITDVENSTDVPDFFSLEQNYPNPFNPSTHINYSVPENNFITLKVFNLLGQEIVILYSGIRQQGNYTAIFDGSGLASGVYLYQLRAGNFIETKKLLLLK